MLVEAGRAAASVGAGEDPHEVASGAVVDERPGAVQAGVVAGLADSDSVHEVASSAEAGLRSGDIGVGFAGLAAVAASGAAGQTGDVAQVAVSGGQVLVVGRVAGAHARCAPYCVGLASHAIILGDRVTGGAEDVAVQASHLDGEIGAWGISWVADTFFVPRQGCVGNTGRALIVLRSGTGVTGSLTDLAVSVGVHVECGGARAREVSVQSRVGFATGAVSRERAAASLAGVGALLAYE